ncbi:MAG: cyclic nucleotide-binding domain-containing protein [Oscillospiraceae bacterium]|nr:cyclic nucleotide-binding domain-containing protein [Oscillospiraceae bacterium]
MKQLSFNKDQVIFEQGTFSRTMFDIISGKVGVFSAYGTENQCQLAVLGSEQTLGEMGMLELYPRSATAVALEDGTVLAEIGEEELTDYFKNQPEKLLNIMRQLSHRLRKTDKLLADACRTVSENEDAGLNGSARSEWLDTQTRYFYEAYMSKNFFMK